MDRRKYSARESRKSAWGFSLVEIIVVISIMAVLGGVLAPQLLKYVENNRITACQVDREAILAVYERCIYAETKKLEIDDLKAVLNREDLATKDEVLQYVACPSKGTYTAEVIDNVAIIHCDHVGHEDVAVDFVGFNLAGITEGIDNPLDPPPVSVDPEPDPPDTEEEPENEEPQQTGNYWPYKDDERWVGKQYPGQYVELDLPTGLFTSREGNTFVIVDRPDITSAWGGKFRVFWEWSLGPEYIDTNTWENCISWSGVLIEDVSTIMYKEYDPTTGTYVENGAITGVHYGDIIVYKGRRYIYGSRYESAQMFLPTEGQNSNNFYLVDPVE